MNPAQKMLAYKDGPWVGVASPGEGTVALSGDAPFTTICARLASVLDLYVLTRQRSRARRARIFVLIDMDNRFQVH